MRLKLVNIFSVSIAHNLKPKAQTYLDYSMRLFPKFRQFPTDKIANDGYKACPF